MKSLKTKRLICGWFGEIPESMTAILTRLLLAPRLPSDGDITVRSVLTSLNQRSEVAAPGLHYGCE